MNREPFRLHSRFVQPCRSVVLVCSSWANGHWFAALGSWFARIHARARALGWIGCAGSAALDRLRWIGCAGSAGLLCLLGHGYNCLIIINKASPGNSCLFLNCHWLCCVIVTGSWSVVKGSSEPSKNNENRRKPPFFQNRRTPQPRVTLTLFRTNKAMQN